MNVEQVNAALLSGDIDQPGLFPRLETLKDSPVIFRVEFGLDALPTEPGVLIIRGARQYGKSTWLEQAMRDTVREFGPGTAAFLDGDHLRDGDHLADELVRLAGALDPKRAVRRLFIDEITAVPDWVRGLKRVLDRGTLRNVLVVTTGSRAADLRHGTERLPGRKGRLERTTFVFLPISFAEFMRAGGNALGDAALSAYIISGGSPSACVELIRTGRIPTWVSETVRDWVLGECARAGRPRRSLVAVMEQLHRHAGTPVGQTSHARDAGLANNSIAAGWIDFLSDLLCVGTSPAWDASKRVEVPRKPAKFPFLNLLVASVFAPESPSSAEEFMMMTPARQGAWHEWAVSQELFRRAALRGEPEPERIPHWAASEHEIDFVLGREEFVEVKRGKASPLEFGWFRKTFPKGELTVVCGTPFRSERVTGVTLEQFLRHA